MTTFQAVDHRFYFIKKVNGIEHELELEPIYQGNAYDDDTIREVPKTLREAVASLDASETMRALLGDEVVDHYVHAGNWEQSEYDRRITDWERTRFFERA